MIKNIKNIMTPSRILGVGLGLTFIYAGTSSLLSPQNWIGFVPEWLNIFPELIKGIQFRESFLFLHGVFEIIMGAWLISGYKTKIPALLSFLSIAAIILFYGIDDVTFRDFGLLSAALALYLGEKK